MVVAELHANGRVIKVDGRVQALVIGLCLTSDTYHTNYYAVHTCRPLISSITIKPLRESPRKVIMPLKIIRSHDVHLINHFIAKWC